MKRLEEVLLKNKKLVSIFLTAGFPTLQDTTILIKGLEKSGVDFLEVGLPYSDPLADGPTIQNSSSVALKNGMNLDVVFNQLISIKDEIQIPLVLMGYLNQIIKYGEDKFCEKCVASGIETIIIPDLPMIEFENYYQKLFAKYGISNVFLITPNTSNERINKIDRLSSSFIYVVASSSITGVKGEISKEQQAYFERIRKMNLKSRLIAGFGISNKSTFSNACKFMDGAIIGSAFINFLQEHGAENGPKFVKTILE